MRAVATTSRRLFHSGVMRGKEDMLSIQGFVRRHIKRAGVGWSGDGSSSGSLQLARTWSLSSTDRA